MILAPPTCPVQNWPDESEDCVPFDDDFDPAGKCKQLNATTDEEVFTDAEKYSCIQLVLSWPQNMTEGDDILLPIPGTEETFHFNCGMLKNQKDTDAMYFCFDTYECEKYLRKGLKMVFRKSYVLKHTKVLLLTPKSLSHEEIVDDLTTSFMDEMLGYTYYYIALGGATWFLATIQTGGLMLQVRAQHQIY